MTLPSLKPARPKFDLELCVRCGKCANICPDDVIHIEAGKPLARDGQFMGCIACGHCVCICPTAAITVEGNGMTSIDVIELSPRNMRATSAQLAALLTARRSIRRFKNKPVERSLIEKIVEMVSTAPVSLPPSGVGVVVFAEREKTQQFADDVCKACQRAVRFFNPFVLGMMRLFSKKADYIVIRDFVKPLCKLLSDERKAGRDVFTWNAPVTLLFHRGPFSSEADVHIAATYAVLAAESLGLGSCMLGTATVVNHDKRLKTKYDIPAENQVGLAVIIGHPDAEFQRGVQRRLQSVKFV